VGVSVGVGVAVAVAVGDAVGVAVGVAVAVAVGVALGSGDGVAAAVGARATGVGLACPAQPEIARIDTISVPARMRFNLVFNTSYNP